MSPRRWNKVEVLPLKDAGHFDMLSPQRLCAVVEAAILKTIGLRKP